MTSPTLPQIVEDRPSYVPRHTTPTWLSSEDVLAAIRDLADAGMDKAACWDFTQSVYALVNRTHLLSLGEGM